MPCRSHLCPALCAVDSFRIRDLYSSQDGDFQYIELEEVAGKDGQDQFAGLTLTVTNRAGVVKTFVFPANLPSTGTANKHVLIMSQGHAQALPNYDFITPNQFLPTDGGTIDFAGIDRRTFPPNPYGALLERDHTNLPHGISFSFRGLQVGCCWGGSVVREYYNANLDQYFMSSREPDIDALDSGRIPGWTRIGKLFDAWSTPWGYGDLPLNSSPLPVCRYFVPPASHFLSASADECDTIARQYPEFVLETPDAFYAYLPDPTTGQCPIAAQLGQFKTTPLYRLWNNRIETNHRFTTSTAVRDEMIAQGWVSEGVAMCVSPLSN
jgi:hypothetical protein